MMQRETLAFDVRIPDLGSHYFQKTLSTGLRSVKAFAINAYSDVDQCAIVVGSNMRNVAPLIVSREAPAIGHWNADKVAFLSSYFAPTDAAGNMASPYFQFQLIKDRKSTRLNS